MPTLSQFTDMLVAIRDAAEPVRSQHVQRFQEAVWNSEALGVPEEVEGVVRELAYDLDFYSSDPAARAQDAALYGEQRLREEIEAALTKIRARSKS